MSEIIISTDDATFAETHPVIGPAYNQPETFKSESVMMEQGLAVSALFLIAAGVTWANAKFNPKKQ